MLPLGDSKLKKHIFYQHNPNPTSEFMCEMCGKCFYDDHDLKNHIVKIHGTGNDILCVKCGEIFKSPNDLRNHTRKIHWRENAYKDGPAKCDLCDKIYKGLNRLKIGFFSFFYRQSDKKY